MKVTVTWRMHLISSANKAETPIAQSARRRTQRDGILLRLANELRKHPPLRAPYTVTLTRIARRKLDAHDNLRHAFKNIADGVCDALGIKDDSSKQIRFEYAQESGQNAVRVEVEGAE